MTLANRASELRYTVRPRVVVKYLGQLCLVMAVIALVPLTISLVYTEFQTSIRYASVIGGLAIVGFLLSTIKSPSNIQTNEGMVIVAFTFLISPLAMTFPLMSEGLNFIDAFFEAVSGITTTGLSTTGSLSGAKATFLFARAWMQWYGALGIVGLSLALLLQPGLVAKGLAVIESHPDDLVGGTRARMQRIILVYSILTLIAITGSFLTGLKISDAILYSFSAISTGGFAPHYSSLGFMGWASRIWIMLVCMMGALPLAFYNQIFRHKRFASLGFLQIKSLLVMIFIITVILGWSMLQNGTWSWSETLRNAPVMATSAQTTAGFSSIPVQKLASSSKLILIIAMLTGGSVGSTAGGIKILRLIITINLILFFVMRTSLPRHAVLKPWLRDRQLQPNDIQEALLLIVLFSLVILFSWLLFLALGYNPIDSLFEVVSATGTVGLSTGITSPDLPLLLKLTLCADMLLGRLEIVAWIVMIYPLTWFGNKMKTS